MPSVIKHLGLRRAELVAVADQLFHRRGFDVTSLNEIVAASRTSHPYGRFPVWRASRCRRVLHGGACGVLHDLPLCGSKYTALLSPNSLRVASSEGAMLSEE